MEEKLILRLVLTDKEAIEFFSNIPRRLKSTAVEQGLKLLQQSEIGHIFNSGTQAVKKPTPKTQNKAQESKADEKTKELIDKNLDIVNNLPKNNDRAW